MRSSLTTLIPYTPPLDWGFALRFLQGRAAPGVERIVEGRYQRTVEAGDAAGIIEVEHVESPPRLRLTLSASFSGHAESIGAQVARLFDLRTDIKHVHTVLLRDPRLCPLVNAAPGIRVPGAWSEFEVLCRAIVGQQVSVKAATTIMGRIIDRCGTQLPLAACREGLERLFPRPAQVASADLSEIGMPGARVNAVKHVADAIASGRIRFPADATDAEELARVKAQLLELPGIGPWTVEYFSMRALGDSDAWPATDLVLRRAMQDGGGRPSLTGMGMAQAWRPWRAYAAMHLWNHATAASSAKALANSPSKRRRRPGTKR